MKRGKLFWKLLLGNVILMVAVLGISVWILARRFDVQAREALGPGAETPSLVWTVIGITLLAAVVLAIGLVRLLSGPIRRITTTARSLSHGDLSAQAEVSGRDELGILARTLNQMRDHLAAQLETIDRQRRTLQSLLAQLHEGVVVAGADGRIVLINPAAIRLLGRAAGPDQNAKAFEGRAVEECVVQHELQQMLLPNGVALGQDSPIREVRLPGPESGEISVLARAADIILPGLADGGGGDRVAPATVGRLLVLTDITALTQMIQVKADFASNASHELRTPLSAIRGAIETILQIDLKRDGESAIPFLDMIDRHSSRMQAMVVDLLNLSRIESAPTQFQLADVNLREMLQEFRAQYTERAEAKALHWEIHLPPDLHTIWANAHLLRLVLDNLIDNAIKFTDVGGQITVACRWEEHSPGRRTLIMEVADDGCGIPPEEQSRVFERFYQVERARSGVARGTGLGLSIVRHAVAAMKGSVQLKSELEKGTTVIITLPQPAADAT